MDNMGMKAAHPTGRVGFQNGGKTTLSMVQNHDKELYWPQNNFNNLNNPGNTGTHRQNNDMRYPGSSQNFQQGGVVTMDNIKQLPRAFSEMVQDVPYLTDKYILGNEDAVNPRTHPQGPMNTGESPFGSLMQTRNQQSIAHNEPYNEVPLQQPQGPQGPPSPNFRQGGKTLLSMVQAGNPSAYWNRESTPAYNPGNTGTHRRNEDMRYPGSSQNFQVGGGAPIRQTSAEAYGERPLPVLP